jgi:hypothetical protein
MPNLATTRGVPRRLTVVIAGVLALGLATGSALAQVGTLEGTVTDADTGLPVSGAMLVAWSTDGGTVLPGQGENGGHYAFSGADGFYTFSDLAAGEYHVFCGKVGYVLADAVATVVENGVTTLDFALQPKVFGSVSGVVTDATTGVPIVGARVGLLPVGGSVGAGGPGGGSGFWLNAVTGPDGSYLFERIPAGEYQAGAFGHGYYPSELATITVVDGETTVADFALQPLAFGRVEGFVTDAASSTPIAGAHVALLRVADTTGFGPEGTSNGDLLWLHAVAGDDGHYAIENVPADDYEAWVWAFGYATAGPVAVSVVEGETTVVDVDLDSLVFGAIEGTVTDAVSGEPIENAVVIAAPSWSNLITDGNEHARWNIVLTDADGHYRIGDVPAGAWTVHAAAWGYRPGRQPVEVVGGQTSIADIALEPVAAAARSR